MVQIYYPTALAVISVIWCLQRALTAFKTRSFSWKRELQLLLVYICIVVVVRFTFFPFFKVDGRIQPLIFDSARVFPPRINWTPLVNLLDYPEPREVLINVIGNTTMFIPLGVVWPSVYRKLDRHWKVIAAGVGFSLAIEILQLPIFDRVSDVDDLLLNSLGYLAGYGLYLLVRGIIRKFKNRKGAML